MSSTTVSLPQIGVSRESRELISLIPELVMKQDGGKGIYFHQALPCLIWKFLKYLPCRASHNVALDTAIRCLTEGIRELFISNHDHKQKSDIGFLVNTSSHLTISYTQAITSLRRSLDDRQESATPEVSLAAVLLCCFEV